MAAISSVIAGAAIASTAYGSITSMSAARNSAKAQQGIVEQELRAEALRKKAMEVDARRKQIEMLRNQQRARSMALAAATSQGAALGSGLQGGYGQIAGQTGNNMVGVDNQLQFGNAMFGINSQISAGRMQMAAAQGQAATGQAFTQMGSTLLQNMGTIKSLSQGFGSGAFGLGNSYGGNGMGTYGGQVRGMGYGGVY